MVSTVSWNSPRASYREGSARTSTCRPFSGFQSISADLWRKKTQRTCAFASFNEK